MSTELTTAQAVPFNQIERMARDELEEIRKYDNFED